MPKINSKSFKTSQLLNVKKFIKNLFPEELFLASKHALYGFGPLKNTSIPILLALVAIQYDVGA
jgi:hypothetical protein